MKDLIIVIDMQNAYLPGMPWACVDMDRTIANIRKLLDSGTDAAFTVFVPPADPKGAWNEYCRVTREINEDEHANALMDEFSLYAGRFPVFSKSVYSSLGSPGLRELLKGYDRAVITGVVAECCVLSTVASLVDDGIPFVYISDAVSGLTRESGKEAEAIVSYFCPVHGSVMDTESYLNDPRVKKM